jgi:2-dehydropantoate 2-reductase
VKRAGVERAGRINATDDAKTADFCDAVLVIAKFHGTTAAMHAAGPMIGPKTITVTLRNGLGSVER